MQAAKINEDLKLNKVKKKKMATVNKVLIYAAVILFTICTLLPVYVLMINATRTNADILTSFTLIPGGNFFNNLKAVINNDVGFNLLRGYLNSSFLAFTSPTIAVYFSALTSFALVCYNFKFKNQLYVMILLTLMLPSQLSIVGFYKYMIVLNTFFNNLFGMEVNLFLDSYLPLILPSVASASCVFFMKQYLESTFERALVEAARIDGAKEFWIFNKIILPLMMPCVATMFIINFIGSWNSFLMPSLVINSQNLYTMPMMVQRLQMSGTTTDQAVVYTGLLLAVLPIIIIFCIFSRWIVAGLSVGSVKG